MIRSDPDTFEDFIHIMKNSTTTPIRSVEKALAILLEVSRSPDGVRGVDVAAGCGLPPATAHHLLETLRAAGFLSKDSRRRYCMGPEVGGLADAFMRQTHLPESLMAALRNLAERTGETAYVSGWMHDDVMVLSTVEGSHAVRVAGLHRGSRGEAHARASGKLLLSYSPPEVVERYLDMHPLKPMTEHTITDLDELLAEFAAIRRRGYAVDLEEYAEGVSCVAAPLINDGVAVLAYTVSAPWDRFRRNQRALTAAVLDAVRGAHDEAPA
jgi:IclR family transcriptional regulator, acetate operon repressor